jgi:hypothetical protein
MYSFVRLLDTRIWSSLKGKTAKIKQIVMDTEKLLRVRPKLVS